MKKVFIALLLSFTIFLSSCSNGEQVDQNVVYVTTYPVQYLVEEIAGDTVIVKRVPGSTIHSESIDWGAKEIIDMLDSDLLFYVNGGLDTYIPNNADTTFEDGNVELVDISKAVTYNQVCYTHVHDHDDDESHTEEEIVDSCDENMVSDDPHFWLDPVRMKEAASLVKDKLIATFPENQEQYNNAYTVLNASLEKLDDDYQKMADEAIKPIITTVMLFTYWHERYDLEILSITNSAHSSESDPGDIIELKEEALYHFIHYIMFEKNANSPAGEQVLTQLQLEDETASALYLHGLGNITEEEVNSGKTYLTIMYENLEALKTATK